MSIKTNTLVSPWFAPVMTLVSHGRLATTGTCLEIAWQPHYRLQQRSLAQLLSQESHRLLESLIVDAARYSDQWATSCRSLDFGIDYVSNCSHLRSYLAITWMKGRKSFGENYVKARWASGSWTYDDVTLDWRPSVFNQTSNSKWPNLYRISSTVSSLLALTALKLDLLSTLWLT